MLKWVETTVSQTFDEGLRTEGLYLTVNITETAPRVLGSPGLTDIS